MGLTVLPYLDHILTQRKRVVDFYDSHLKLSSLSKMKIRKDTEWNYSYYPIVFSDEKSMLNVMSALKKEEIISRRYFCPSLNAIPFVNGGKMPVSEDISNRILCLPLYAELEEKDLDRICNTINALL